MSDKYIPRHLVLVPTCLTLFLELLTRNMPRVWRPKFSRWRKQACTMWGMLGSLSPKLMSAVDPQDRVSSRPGTLPAMRSPGDMRLSQDPLWRHRDIFKYTLSLIQLKYFLYNNPLYLIFVNANVTAHLNISEKNLTNLQPVNNLLIT
jgi:hypothetical protein